MVVVAAEKVMFGRSANRKDLQLGYLNSSIHIIIIIQNIYPAWTPIFDIYVKL